MKKCRSCMQYNLDDAKFCIYCHKQLDINVDSSHYCKNCGAILLDDSICLECGTLNKKKINLIKICNNHDEHLFNKYLNKDLEARDYYNKAKELNQIKVGSVEAFKLYEKAAKLGHPLSQYLLGCCYYYGDGTNVDMDKALYYLELAANNDIVEAMYMLYNHYIKWGDIPNYQKAMNYLLEASNKEYPPAMYSLGLKNRDDFTLIEKAIKAKYPLAKYHLNKQFEYTKGEESEKIAINNNMELLELLKDEPCSTCISGLFNNFYYDMSDPYSKEALTFYRFSADEGYIRGEAIMGYCYGNGFGLEENVDEAVKWYQLASLHGYSFAEASLGQIYCRENFDDDYYDAEAYRLFVSSANKNDLDGIYFLACCYLYGIGTDINESKALNLFNKAAQQGHYYSQEKLKELYTQNKEEQLADFWADVLEHSDILSLDLTTFCPNMDVKGEYSEEELKVRKKVLDIFWEFADISYQDAKYKLAELFYGEGTHDDYAISLVARAAKAGHPKACLLLGNIYLEGKIVDINIEEAIYWYKLAATSLAYAASMLGIIYYYGLNGKADKKEAAKWFKLSADSDEYIAELYLGDAYYYGEGVRIDMVEAAKYYALAANNGQTIAHNKYADCLYNGIGTKVDRTKAIRQYKYAYNEGDDFARYRLKAILG